MPSSTVEFLGFAAVSVVSGRVAISVRWAPLQFACRCGVSLCLLESPLIDVGSILLKFTLLPADVPGAMLYFFQRADSVIRCEIRLDWDGDGYELLIHTRNAVRVERFQDTIALTRRWSQFEGQLIKEGWSEPDAGRA